MWRCGSTREKANNQNRAIALCREAATRNSLLQRYSLALWTAIHDVVSEIYEGMGLIEMMVANARYKEF